MWLAILNTQNLIKQVMGLELSETFKKEKKLKLSFEKAFFHWV